MMDKLKELNDYIDMLKNDNEIDCIEHIKKKQNTYVWCLNLIDTAVYNGDIIDNELQNAIKILKQIIKEAQNNINYSKTGFCSHEGQDRAHLHSIRYLIASKIKEIYCFDENDNLLSFPINENSNIDINNIKLIKSKYEILLETYLSCNQKRIIKLAIIDENINNCNKIKQYDFIANLNDLTKVYFKKITGIIADDYYPFQDDGLRNIKSIEKLISYENKNLIEYN